MPSHFEQSTGFPFTVTEGVVSDVRQARRAASVVAALAHDRVAELHRGSALGGMLEMVSGDGWWKPVDEHVTVMLLPEGGVGT